MVSEGFQSGLKQLVVSEGFFATYGLFKPCSKVFFKRRLQNGRIIFELGFRGVLEGSETVWC